MRSVLCPKIKTDILLRIGSKIKSFLKDLKSELCIFFNIGAKMDYYSNQKFIISDTCWNFNSNWCFLKKNLIEKVNE